MKKHLASALEDLIKSKLKTPLKCTGKLRPLQETVDKMTHFHTTSQMEVCIAPLLNEYELFSQLYIKSYPVEYTKGSYENLTFSMREKGDFFVSYNICCFFIIQTF